MMEDYKNRSKDLHPILELNFIVDYYKKKKDSFEIKELQTIREDLSLALFYLSDTVGEKYSHLDGMEFKRRRSYAKREESYRNGIDPKSKKRYVGDQVKNLARLDNEEMDEMTEDAKRQKEKMRIIVDATKNIINSISTRLKMLGV